MTTDQILDHINKLLEIPGARLLFGGKPLENHNIPKVYGAVEPTAVFVPLQQIVKNEYFGLVTTEVFGPFQVREDLYVKCKIFCEGFIFISVCRL